MQILMDMFQSRGVLITLGICVFLLTAVVTAATLPSMIANLRGHHSRAAITALNLLAILCSFGFFLIVPALIALVMWFIALVWAFTAVHRTGPPVVIRQYVAVAAPPGSPPRPAAVAAGGRAIPSPPPVKPTPAVPVEVDAVPEDGLDVLVGAGPRPSVADRLWSLLDGVAEGYRSLPEWAQMSLIGVAVAAIPVALLVALFGSR